jgi:hypothetical protein
VAKASVVARRLLAPVSITRLRSIRPLTEMLRQPAGLP